MSTTPTLTTREREQLAAATRKAAQGIAEAWEVINRIASRTSFDWFPRNTSMGEIAGQLAAEIDQPEDAAKIETQDAVSRFLCADNWSRPWMRRGPRETTQPGKMPTKP